MRQFIDGPVALRLFVHQAQGPANVRVVQPDQPAGLVGGELPHVLPEQLDEHQLGQAAEHGLASWAPFARFVDRVP